MSTNEERQKEQRSVSDEDFAARLFEAWTKKHGTGLTATEIAELRELIEFRKRVQWITGGLKTWAVWLVAIVGASTVGLDTLTKILKSLLQR